MSKMHCQTAKEEKGDPFHCRDNDQLARELEVLREHYNVVVDRLAATTAELNNVQNESRTALLVLEALTENHKDLQPIIEELKVAYNCNGGDGWVTAEEYHELAKENKELHMLLQEQPIESMQVHEVNRSLQVEIMRLTAENIALKAGAERREAESEALLLVQTKGRLPRPNVMRPKSTLLRRMSLAQNHDSYSHRSQLTEPLPILEATNQIMARHPSSNSLASSSSQGKGSEHAKKPLFGALAYSPDDEDAFIERAISAVQPMELTQHTPGLIGHVLFMCIRYMDQKGDAAGMQSLLRKAIAAIQDVIKQTKEAGYADLDLLVFWLANCCRLLSDMKQYSGDPKYAANPRPGQEPLKNFDLTEYRRVLGDLCIMIHKILLRVLQEEVGHLAEAVLLYHEGLTEMPANHRARLEEEEDQETVESLIDWFEQVKAVFERHFLDPEITYQTISELISYCLGLCFNILLTTPELCTDLRALQITYNVQQFHAWFRNDTRIANRKALTMLMEATNILQLPKDTVESIELICATCKATPVTSIQQLLVLYTNEMGEHISASILEEGLRKGWEEIQARVELPPPLLVDLARTPPITIPYTPKDVLLADLAIPDFLGLHMLRKI